MAELVRDFGPRVSELLATAPRRQRRFDAGELPDFLAGDARDPRAATGRVAPIPADLLDRRVEITGPVDRKMIINALNSGARRLHGRLRGLQRARPGTTCVEGQVNLRDAVRGTIDVHEPARARATA